MFNKMKRKYEKDSALNMTVDELCLKYKRFDIKKSSFALCSFLVLLGLVFGFIKFYSVHMLMNIDSNENEITFAMQNVQNATTSSKKETIAVATGLSKANPFLPYRDFEGEGTKLNDVSGFDIIEPPEEIDENTNTARLMNTVVSGILYDTYNPSAIINIEGNDYLVKKGDVVNNYKVVNIMRDSVTVKLGENTYKAGIGEILTEGVINNNTVSNLSKKFGGSENEK